MQLVVRSRTPIAQDILSLELALPDGAELPTFTAGAHIDLHLPNGLNRSYSLVNDPAERHRYVIAVNREIGGRGGSAFVHDVLKPGDAVEVTGPRNNFALVEDAPELLLIAGGIGITPLYCMIQRLERIGQPWRLFYAARSRDKAAYLPELHALEAAAPGCVRLYFNDEHAQRPPEMAAIVATTSPDAHLYCCGPAPMLAAFLDATSDRPESRIHVEYFSAAHEAATEGGYTVELARSGRSFHIPEGKTILNVLLEAGVNVDYSCEEGTCGTCETAVIEGEPDHRDSWLTPAERAAGKTMMICCSGSKSRKLVLDL
jgi:ferredoxin-NADP reductase